MFYGRSITFFLVNFLTTFASISAFLALPSAGQSVTLAWNPSITSTTEGYHLYYGGVSGDYTNTLDVGSNTVTTIRDLASGATYFFAVTAYDIIGLESVFSDEISYTIPGASLTAHALPLGQMLLIGQGPVGFVYEIQTSADMHNWSRVASETMDSQGAFQVKIPKIASDSARWYRLRQTAP